MDIVIKIVSIAVCSIAIVSAVTPPAPVDSATYICRSDTEIAISEIDIQTFTPGAVFAKNKFSTCSNFGAPPEFRRIGTSDRYETEIRVGTLCDYKSENGVQTLEVFVTKSDKGVIRINDIIITFVCNGGQNEVLRTASISNVQGDPEVIVTPKLDFDVELEVVPSPNGGTPLTTGSIGDKVKLQMTLEQHRFVTRCIPRECVVAPDDTFDPANVITMIDADGCSVFTLDVFTNPVTRPFIQVPTTDDTQVSRSPEFRLFRFPTVSSLFFRCKCDACTDVSPAGTCVWPVCPPSTRKRRAATHIASFNNTVPAQTAIFIVDKNFARPARDLKGGMTNCLNNINFITVVAILCLLLVISLAMSTFFCWRLIGRMRPDAVQKERQTAVNAGFKA